MALGGPSAGYIMLQCYNVHQDNIVFISFYVDNANRLPYQCKIHYSNKEESKIHVENMLKSIPDCYITF